MNRVAGRRNAEWETPKKDFQWQHVSIEVLMDIRDQLKELNATLSCYRVREMADAIRRTDKRLARRYPLTPRKKP